MKEKELKFFKAKHEHIKGQFPRFCGTCGIVWTDELDNVLLTEQLEGHIDARSLINPEGKKYGRVFFANCICNSTSTIDMQFKSEDEIFNYDAEFFKAVEEKAKTESKRPTKVVGEFRKDYIKWLMINHPSVKYLVLGIGNHGIEEHFKKHPLYNTAFINSEKFTNYDSTPEKRDQMILEKNLERVSLLIVEPKESQLKYHAELVQILRNSDRKHKRHTNILAAGKNQVLKYGYNRLDINGYVDTTDLRATRRIISTYLGLKTKN